MLPLLFLFNFFVYLNHVFTCVSISLVTIYMILYTQYNHPYAANLNHQAGVIFRPQLFYGLGCSLRTVGRGAKASKLSTENIKGK